jgi:hypothetical protein
MCIVVASMQIAEIAKKTLFKEVEQCLTLLIVTSLDLGSCGGHTIENTSFKTEISGPKIKEFWPLTCA